MRRVATGDAVVFPAASLATTRRSQNPSTAAPVTKSAAYGAPVSRSIVDQVPAPAGERSKRAEPTPFGSDAVAVMWIVPASTAPGSSSPTVGAVVSIVHVSVAAEPALPS